MQLQFQIELNKTNLRKKYTLKQKDIVFSKDYVYFLKDAGWKLEKNLPSNSNYYSDQLQDTDWKQTKSGVKPLKQNKRDLDALS
tara:strand:- start:443 stop:694 length:252 start_codon:yes stop_codon:yes gene_type:complete